MTEINSLMSDKPLLCLSLLVLIERKRGRWAALSIAAIVIIVGIPLWWRTTETYRAWLPVSQIKDLANLQVCFFFLHLLALSYLVINVIFYRCYIQRYMGTVGDVFCFVSSVATVEYRCGGCVCARNCDARAAEEGPTDTGPGWATQSQWWFIIAVNEFTEFKDWIVTFKFSFSDDTTLRYSYEMKFRTATVMEEDALHQPTAAGIMSSPLNTRTVCPHVQTVSRLNEIKKELMSLSLVFIIRGRSISAHAQWESMWFFGCISAPRVILTVYWGKNLFPSVFTVTTICSVLFLS